jgi:hypothetical protein
MDQILDKFFTPEKPEMTGEEQAFLQAQRPAQPIPAAPSVQAALQRIEQARRPR